MFSGSSRVTKMTLRQVDARTAKPQFKDILILRMSQIFFSSFTLYLNLIIRPLRYSDEFSSHPVLGSLSTSFCTNYQLICQGKEIANICRNKQRRTFPWQCLQRSVMFPWLQASAHEKMDNVY